MQALSCLRCLPGTPRWRVPHTAHRCPRPVRSQAGARACAAQIAEEVPSETYLGEKFSKFVPKKSEDTHQAASAEGEDAIQLKALNHMALDVFDVEKVAREARPPFPFDGAWLTGGGIVLHLIKDDPTVPETFKWRKKIVTKEASPEEWYIRRAVHKAFEVESLDKAEARLQRSGIEYHKFLVPGTNAAQIFLYDPEGNGVELGEHYDEIAKSLIGKAPK